MTVRTRAGDGAAVATVQDARALRDKVHQIDDKGVTVAEARWGGGVGLASLFVRSLLQGADCAMVSDVSFLLGGGGGLMGIDE